MPSVVNICNLALSHLGDIASVASIDPPENSAQAELCARFYPIARDTLLEMHPWGFATRRAALTPLAVAMDAWSYVYTWPNLALRVFAVVPDGATDDYTVAGEVVPQPFHVEALESGAKVICTNVENAVARFVASVTDSSQFTPLFTTALSWLLASYLAGPILKQEAGAAEAKRCLAFFNAAFSDATRIDANQRMVMPQHTVPWISGR